MTVVYRDELGIVQLTGIDTIQFLDGKVYIDSDSESITIDLIQLLSIERS